MGTDGAAKLTAELASEFGVSLCEMSTDGEVDWSNCERSEPGADGGDEEPPTLDVQYEAG